MSVRVGAGVDKPVSGERSRWEIRVIQEVVDLLSGAFALGELTAAKDLEGIERHVQRLQRRIGQVLTTAVAQQAVADCPRPNCARCHKPMQRRNCRTRRLCGTTADDLRLQRVEYRCSDCGEVATPADRIWELGRERLTPALQRVLARAGAEVASFQRAADLVGDILGLDLSEASAARTTEALGAVAEQQMQQTIATVKAEPSQPPCQRHKPTEELTLLVGVDATKAHAGGRWRDAKIGVVAPLGPQVRVDPKDGHRTLQLGPRTYCAGIESADRFFDRVTLLAARAGWQPSARVRVLLLGDGGAWIWERADRLRAEGVPVVEILDSYHAREHIWAVAHGILGDGVKGYQWGEQLCIAMLAEGGLVVPKALAKLRPRTKAKRELLETAQAYFQANLARMDYPYYAQQGWPLGSGVVESSCRLVCGLRCKQPGMRWSLRGVQNVLSIRALALSTTTCWETFWASHPQTRRPLVTALTNSLETPDAA